MDITITMIIIKTVAAIRRRGEEGEEQEGGEEGEEQEGGEEGEEKEEKE